MMKKYFYPIVATFFLVVALAIIFCLYLFQFNTYTLSPQICNAVLGVQPEEFYAEQGKNTVLENGYTKTYLDSEGNLILKMTDQETQDWIENSFHMEIFYAILKNQGEKSAKENGSVLEKTKNHWFNVFEGYEPSDGSFTRILLEGVVNCGITVSEDYTQVTVDYDADLSYLIFLPSSCSQMQVIEGKKSEDIAVEFIFLGENDNQIKHRSVWPMDEIILPQ